MPTLLGACLTAPLIGRPARDRTFRADGRPLCWAFRTRGGTFGPAHAGTFRPISRPVRPACTRTVRSACLGSVRPPRARTIGPACTWTIGANPRPVRSACTWAVRSACTGTVGSARARSIWPRAGTIGPGTGTIRAPDARRPCARAERRTPIRRWRLPYRRTDPDLVPAAIIPAPPVIPGRADKHSSAEDQCAGQSARENSRGIVNRHIDPLWIGRRDVNNS